MDEFEHYNFDQDKHVNMGVGGEGQHITKHLSSVRMSQQFAQT